MTQLLEVSGLNAGYGDFRVLHGIDFVVEAGGITTLLGANGAGKTTTLRAISGMIKRTGTVLYDGNPLPAGPTEAITALSIAHVPEGRGTFTGLTTEENLQCGAMTRPAGKEINDDIERIFAWFPRLKERRSQQAGTLSGGEQQMLAVARALMLKPKLMLLDEPSFGLAPMIVAELYEKLAMINRDEGVGLLIVEQNAGLVLELADRAYLLETGDIVKAGTAAEMRDDEAIRTAYLGY